MMGAFVHLGIQKHPLREKPWFVSSKTSETVVVPTDILKLCGAWLTEMKYDIFRQSVQKMKIPWNRLIEPATIK